MELNFLDGELNYEVTRDSYALVEDDIIKVVPRCLGSNFVLYFQVILEYYLTFVELNT